MTFDNITLQLLMGSVSEPKPAQKEVMEALQEIQVIHNEKEQSGFEIKFDTGRSQRYVQCKSASDHGRNNY
jgi:hypothetical protein